MVIYIVPQSSKRCRCEMAYGIMDECYQVALQLVKDAGKLVRDRIWKKKYIETKSCEVDLVTETDKEVENLLISGLSSHFPTHKFIAEEATAAGEKCELTDDPTWIIDPVDGTMNFVHGFPNVCVSIGLWKNKTAEIGIIYNPILELLFTARKGQGSYMNGTRIHASQETELSKALLLFEMGTSRDPEKMKGVVENFSELVPIVRGIRSLGSAAMNMAMVALGAADAYYDFGIHAWDMAAGDIIVREAGGTCLDPAGGAFDVMSCRMLCAGTQPLANKIVPKLKQYYPEHD